MAGPTRAQLIARQEEFQQEIEVLRHGLEVTYSDYALLARQLDDMQMIDLSGYGQSTSEDTLPNAKRVEVITRLRRLRHENPIAKQAIKLMLRFTYGKGITYLVKDDQIREIVDAFWGDANNQIVLTSRRSMVQRFDETLTDGEWFLAMFGSPVAPYVRLGRVPMEEVTDTLYDPDNGEIPVWYRRTYRKRTWDANLNNGQGGWVVDTASLPTVEYWRDYRITDDMLTDIEERGLTIPEAKRGAGVLMHVMVNPVRMKNGWRGISELFASREWFRVFKEFMEDRGAINAAANALSFKRKIKGGPATVASFSNRLGGVKMSPAPNDSLTGDAILRLTRPQAGAIYDENEGVDLQGQRVDTGAVHAERDARLILMAGGAGVATSINYFGESAGALSSAQMMELPMVKGYEDFQTEQAEMFTEVVRYVLLQAQGVDAVIDSKAIAWNFPPIITQDVVKWITAIAQWAQQIAPGNEAVRRLAIISGMTVLNIPNAAQELAAIDDVEQRINTDNQKKRDLALKAQQNAIDNPPVPGDGVNAPPGGNGALTGGSSNGKNGNGNGQRAGGGPQPSAFDPNLQRLAGGKPPAEPPTGPRTRRQ